MQADELDAQAAKLLQRAHQLVEAASSIASKSLASPRMPIWMRVTNLLAG